MGMFLLTVIDKKNASPICELLMYLG